MEGKKLQNSYLFALAKLILALIVAIINIKFTESFIKILRSLPDLSIWIVYLSFLLPFAFYVFIVDLNNLYKKIQSFFFRNSFLSLLFPSLLIILVVGYLLIPKLLNVTFSKNIYLLFGGVATCIHLIFTAKETKSSGFIGFTNYLLIFNIIYTITIFIFGGYLRIGFDFHVGKAATEGIKKGVVLLKDIVIQIFKGT